MEDVNIHLDKTSKVSELKNCTILLGDETFYQDKIIAHYKKLIFKDSVVEQNSNYFCYEKITTDIMAELNENIYAGGFFSKEKLFIIRDASLFGAKKDKPELLQALLKITEDIPEGCYLMFLVDKLEKNIRNFKEYQKSFLYLQLSPQTTCLNCIKLRFYEIKDWLGQEVKKRKLNFTREAYDSIVMYCQYTDNISLSVLVNEFDKLALVISNNEAITRKKFQEISQLSMQVSVFRLIEYFFKKDQTNVLLIFDELIMQNTALEAVAMPIAGQIKKVIQLKRLQAENLPLVDFSKEYRLTSYLLNKLVKDSLYLSIEELKKMHNDIVEFLYNLRSGLKDVADFKLLLLNFCKS